MIKYIQSSLSGSIVFSEKLITSADKPLNYVKNLCVKHLVTFDGYFKAVKEVFGFCKKAPLVLDNEIQLFATHAISNPANIWINYAAVEKIIFAKKYSEIVFYDNSSIQISLSKQQIQTIIERIKVIEKYRNNLNS